MMLESSCNESILHLMTDRALVVASTINGLHSQPLLLIDHRRDELSGGVRMARYELPDLPYDYDALEPHIDARIMELHHDKHHQGYVDGANAALDNLESMRESGDFSGMKAVERNLSFHTSGHINHSVFWGNMSPDGGGEPGGELADAISEDFGSFENFKNPVHRGCIERRRLRMGGCSSMKTSPTSS